LRLLQTRPPEQVVGILLFSLHLIHTKVMDSRGRSERERWEKSGPRLKFTRFEVAPSFSLRAFKNLITFVYKCIFMIMITCYLVEI